MPQLDVSTYPSQLFWLAVSFLSLYLILHFFIVPRFQRIFENRTHSIDTLTQQASRDREEAELLLNEYEQTLAEARIEAHNRFKSVFDEVTATNTKKQSEVLERISSRLREHEQQLYRERLDARKDLESMIVDVTATILKKTTGKIYSAPSLKSKLSS